MGFAISWLAVSGKDPQQVLQELQLHRTGETEEFPESPVSAAQLPTGWFLVFANRFASPLVADRSLQQLSAGCTVISCQVEEHVMFSSVMCYANGKNNWHVTHDAQEGIYHLSVSGDLPPQFNDIYASLKQEQDDSGGDKSDVDYIHDVPVSLAKVITSFRHDQDIQGGPPEPFEALASSSSPASAKPWWKIW
ncbi:hypothetical protein [Lysobacter sp. Root916]|uniref:hypothetical protein n=1 Tax=Lysobacter sp. Root916 TaxID=1736606 RepID=UPI0012F86CE2|nr:hypothetical protein [Lysobacter sp. Root916]